MGSTISMMTTRTSGCGGGEYADNDCSTSKVIPWKNYSTNSSDGDIDYGNDVSTALKSSSIPIVLNLGSFVHCSFKRWVFPSHSCHQLLKSQKSLLQPSKMKSAYLKHFTFHENFSYVHLFCLVTHSHLTLRLFLSSE